MDKNEETQGDGRLQVYELGFHIVPIVSVDALPAEAHAIRSLVESNGGVVISEEAPKSRELAYTISRMRAGKSEKFDTAYFGWVKFETLASAINAVKAGIEKNENVLRYLIIKTVRENTMAEVKMPIREGQEKAPEEKKVAVVAAEEPKLSEAEIDKTIDDMVKE